MVTVKRSRYHPQGSVSRVRRCRQLVIGFAVVALVFKVMMAFQTYGTGDIGHWRDFSTGVRQAGPIGVYGLSWPTSFYNHPPLIGYFLEIVNGLQHLGIKLQSTIRTASSLADVVTAVVVFELLRRRGSLKIATWSGVLVGVSPVLFTVSGFHGNTDPIFTMLTLLSVYLLADRDRPVMAGVAMALALGIKIVPVVAVPALLIYALSRGTRTFWQYAAGLGVVFAITWGPTLVLQGGNVFTDVIGYKGVDLRQWGLVQIGHWLGDPAWTTFLAGPGRFVVLLLCCAVPAYFVWRRPSTLAAAVGLALVGFLVLSPAFGIQYTVWPLAGAYLIRFGTATAYNLAAGWMTIAIYNAWNRGLPWNIGHSTRYTSGQVDVGIIAWAALLAVAVQGMVLLVSKTRRSALTDADDWVKPAWLTRLGRTSALRPDA